LTIRLLTQKLRKNAKNVRQNVDNCINNAVFAKSAGRKGGKIQINF